MIRLKALIQSMITHIAKRSDAHEDEFGYMSYASKATVVVLVVYK